jgi:hypothetical protein
MSGARIILAREGYKPTTASALNKSYDNLFFTPKIFKYKRVAAGSPATDAVTFSHGLSYPPRGLSYVEIDDDPLTVGYNRGGYVADDSDITMTPGQHYDYSTSPYTATDNTGVYGVCMLDPLGTPSSTPAPHTKTSPVIIAGTPNHGADYSQELNTYYDTLKVYSSGTLTVSADAEEIADTDNHWYTATYTHNLGYIPMYAPFVPYSEELGVFYSWYYQWYSYQNSGLWKSGLQYGPNHLAKNDGTWYECKKFHTASSSTEPGSGGSWTTYWELDENYVEWTTSTAYVVGDITEVHYTQWATSTSYTGYVDYVYNDGVDYMCLADHTSSSSTEPGTGASWETYWGVVETPAYYCYTAHTSSSSTKPGSGASWEDKWWNLGEIGVRSDVYLNEHEQDRIVFGGAEAFKTEAVYFYVTETQLVLKYLRRAFDDGFGWQDNKFAKLSVSVDYTVFHNRLDEDYDVLA